MRRRYAALALAVLAVPAGAGAAEPFTYAGIGLGTTMAALKARYPASRVAGDVLHVDVQESRDHVYQVVPAGTRRPRAVRLSFQRPAAGERRALPRYPKCKAIEADLRARYGAPDEIRKFAEEASQRADRTWRSARETLTLMCFVGPGTEMLAEGLLIAER